MLVPAYNAGTTLAATLKSAMASTGANLEIVVVDDGSTDATSAIVEEMAASEPRLRLLRQEHRGVSAALNRGLAQVRGDYVARLDADDLWHPSKLEKQVAVMADNPDVDLVYSFVRYVDGKSRLLRDAVPLALSGPALCQCLYRGIDGGGSSVLFRRSGLDHAGGYDEKLSVWEDLLVHLKVVAQGALACVPEYLVGYRVRSDSSSSDPVRSLRNSRLVRQRIASAFPQIPAFVQRWSNARRLFELAEEFAGAGHYLKSAMLVAECFRSDFSGTSARLAYRLTRNSSARRAPGPLFDDCDPVESYTVSRFDSGFEGARLRKLEQSRATLLRSLDRRLSGRGSD